MQEVNFHRGQNLRVIAGSVTELTVEGGHSKGMRSQCFYGHADGAKQQIQTHVDVDLQLVCHFLLSLLLLLFFFLFPGLCKKINTKGTLRSGPYTLFILGNDKSL